MENLKTTVLDTLTALEQECLQALISGLYAEEGFSDVDANDIAAWINKDIKSVRGSLGSLQKKGVICIADPNDGGYKIIYLHSDYYFMHPEWSINN
jgi:predicted transcriptional regulator